MGEREGVGGGGIQQQEVHRLVTCIQQRQQQQWFPESSVLEHRKRFQRGTCSQVECVVLQSDFKKLIQQNSAADVSKVFFPPPNTVVCSV